MALPDNDDVIIRRSTATRPPSICWAHSLAPDQFIVRTRDEAVSQALAYAKRQHVRAWFANGDEDFVLLGTFREDPVKSARP